MRSWAQPTADEIGRVQALATRPENRAYFFDRLENPLWVVPLAKSGFFADPPAPIPVSEPGYVSFPPWPEGRYLVRVASSLPGAVADVLAGIPQSGNPTVSRHLFEAVLALPDVQFRQLSNKVLDWLAGPFAEHFADEAAAVIARLLEIEEVTIGLSAAAILLAVQSDERLPEKVPSDDSLLRPQPEAVGRMSEWQYERVLDRLLGAIVQNAGIKGVRFIAGLLEDALRISGADDEETRNYSHIWRPAIEDHEQNWETGVKNVLTSTLRDAAVRLSATGEDKLVEVMNELERGSLLQRRIALHVLSYLAFGASLVSERLGDRRLFDEHRVKHEYAALLRRRFGDADEDAQQRVLMWIHEGPDVDAFRQRRTEFDGVSPSDDAVERYSRQWRRDWYSFIAKYLDSAETDAYRALVAELGEPDHPDFLSWSSSWVGPESPIARNDLLQRDPADVIEYLRSWTSDDDSGWRFGPTNEGLGRTLSEVVTERVAEYAALSERLTDLDPTYVRSFFSGLEGALRKGGSFGWDEPLALAAFVGGQPFETDDDLPDRDRDPGWRWCRREIASLLRLGFADRGNRIPFRLREDAWRLVDRLTGDPNPSPEHEQRYGGDNMDPLTLSINTNRGTAMHAVVEYALWTRRELTVIGRDITVGFDVMPEVRAVLERHLDPEVDPSLAVRAVYGRWLPWLLLLDDRWVVDHVGEIFPATPEHSPLRDAAWSTYVYWCPPYDSAFRALRREYEAAIRLVPSGRAAGLFRRESADAKLGEHLLTFFWRGVVEEALLDEFFDRADDELASHVMEFVGRVLQNTEGDLSEQIRQRIEAFWNRRLDAAAGDPETHRLEARAFGMSFASGKLDKAWALDSLERSVALAGASRLGHFVVERLVETAASEPAITTRVLAAMLMQPENEWDYLSWRDEAKAIVLATAGNDDVNIIENRGAIVDFYVQRGELDFRDLFTRSRAPDA